MSDYGETRAANCKQEAPRKPKSPGSQVTNGCYFEQERSLQESSLHRFTFRSERESGFMLAVAKQSPQPIARQHSRQSSQHPSMAQHAKHSSQHSTASEPIGRDCAFLEPLPGLERATAHTLLAAASATATTQNTNSLVRIFYLQRMKGMVWYSDKSCPKTKRHARGLTQPNTMQEMEPWRWRRKTGFRWRNDDIGRAAGGNRNNDPDEVEIKVHLHGVIRLEPVQFIAATPRRQRRFDGRCRDSLLLSTGAEVATSTVGPNGCFFSMRTGRERAPCWRERQDEAACQDQ